MYFFKTPSLFKKLFPDLTWSISTKEPFIYLTFDDGPIPQITPWVLDCLKDYNIKATFFCIGKHVKAHPKIYDQILKADHQIGNHTYNHIKGWSTQNEQYYEDVQHCRKLVDSTLFRPPYGKIMFLQTKALRVKGYEIVMWDVLSGDFDAQLGRVKCLKNVIKNTEAGSIVVFHDSIKAAENMKYTVPRFIEYFLNKGYQFKKL